MSAEDKAIELLNKFYDYVDGTNMFETFEHAIAVKKAKECAIILIDEIKNECIRIDEKFNLGSEGTKQYWDAVRDQIGKLNV